MEKKHDGRFTIQFNTKDPRQCQAVQKLDQQGRRKAQFLTEAILHYDLAYAESGSPRYGGEIEDHELEAKILHILNKYGVGISPSKRRKSGAQSHENESENNASMDDSVVTAITKTLSAFAGFSDE